MQKSLHWRRFDAIISVVQERRENRMTSKERAQLRAQSNGLKAVFQVGKEGVTPAVAGQMLESFHTRELLKGKVLLESCPQPPHAVAATLAELTGAEVVQVVGGSMVFFKENLELRKKIEEKEKKKKVI
jgi:RNA-binding protein